MSFQKECNTSRYRMAILRERVSSLKEENATMKQKNKNLEDVKELMRYFNNHVIPTKNISI